MTSWQATSEDPPASPDGTFRAIGITAVFIGVAALAAATFVLSYQGIRAVALQAGIEPRYARGYPLLIDAMLVIVLAAVLALRGAGLPSRMLAWLTLLVVLCAAAGADTLHATGRTLPHNAAVITAAVLPWALVFVAFLLLLAMLRHARLRRHARAALAQPSVTPPADAGQARSQLSPTGPAPLPVRSPQPWNSVSIVPGFTSQLVTSAAAGAAAGAAVADVEPWPQGAAPDDAQPIPAANGLEAIAVMAAEPVALAPELAVQTAEPVETAAVADDDNDTAAPADDTSPADDPTSAHAPEAVSPAQPDEPEALTDEPEALTDEPEALTDEPEALTDEPDPSTGDAPPTQAAVNDPGTDEVQAQSGAEDDMPVFHRIRSSPTPPDD